MFCPQCGRETSADAKFCPFDGTPLSQVGTDPAPQGGQTVGGSPQGQTPGGAASAALSQTQARTGLARSRWPQLSSIPLWIVPVALLLVVVVIGGGKVLGNLQEEERKASYARAVEEAASRNFEAAVVDFRAAGDYLDAKERLSNVQQQFDKALALYEQAIQLDGQGRSWDAEYAFRQALDIHPKLRDTEARLAALRLKLGRVWYATVKGTGVNPQLSLWSAWPDGGDAREVASAGNFDPLSTFSGPRLVAPSRVAFSLGSSVYVSDVDGKNRKEIVSGAQNVQIIGGSTQGQPFGVAASGPSTNWAFYSVAPASGDRQQVLTGSNDDFSLMGSSGNKVLVVKKTYPQGRPPSSPPPTPTAVPRFAPTPVRAPLPTYRTVCELTLVDLTTGDSSVATTASGSTVTSWGTGSCASARVGPDGAIFFSDYTAGNTIGSSYLLRSGSSEPVDLGRIGPDSGQFTRDGLRFLLWRNPPASNSWIFSALDVPSATLTDLFQTQFRGSSILPDNARGMFVTRVEGEPSRTTLYRIEEDGGSPLEVLSGASLSLRNNGPWVEAVVKEPDRRLSQLVLLKPDGSGRRDLATGLTEGLPSAFDNRLRAVLSPDSKRAAVVVHDDTQPQASRSRLIVYDLESDSAPVEVTAHAWIADRGSDGFVFWSPDGQYLMYAGSSEPPDALNRSFNPSSSGSSSSSSSTASPLPPVFSYFVQPKSGSKPVELSQGFVIPLLWTGAAQGGTS